MIDRFAEKYKAHSPYVYVLDNPLKSIDINGDTSVVLSAPKDIGGLGHMAALIQNSDDSYGLYSKNGTNENHGAYGPNDKGNDVGSGNYSSPKAFMDSPANPIINKKTGQREYSEGFVIPATKTQDKAAIVAATKELNKDYNVVGSNCAVTVQKALDAAGKSDGSPSFFDKVITTAIGAIAAPIGGAAIPVANDKTPNLIYKRIKAQNDGTVVKP